MTAIPNPEKITAEEYFRLTKDIEERTELIDGHIVFLDRDETGNPLALAAPSTIHQTLVGRLFSRADSFILANQGTCKALLAPYDVVLDDENTVQPDVFVVCDGSKIDDHRCNGAPDWIIEVTSSNRMDDFARKLALYKLHGVREYWIVDTDGKRVIVYNFDQHPNVVEFYDWTDTIPVSIYGGKLTIRIADLV